MRLWSKRLGPIPERQLVQRANLPTDPEASRERFELVAPCPSEFRCPLLTQSGHSVVRIVAAQNDAPTPFPPTLAAQRCRRPGKFSDIAILRKGIEWISSVNKTGAADGEKSFYFTDRFDHHATEVCALETSQFHVANAATLFSQDPIAVLYVATVLAHRLDAANHALIQLKSQLKAGQPNSVVAKTVSKIEGLLAVSGASLVYAGYPFDPFA